MGQYIQYSQIYSDKCPSLEYIQQYLSQFHISYLLQLFGKANIAFWRTESNSRDFVTLQQHLLDIYFPYSDKKKIERKANLILKSTDSKRVAVFHRHQMLMAIKLSLLSPNYKGKQVTEKHEFGRILLAISEYLGENEVDVGINLFDKLHFEFSRKSFSKLAYFNHQGRFVHNVSRALEFYINFPKDPNFKQLLLDEKVQINIDSDFERLTGLGLEEFVMLSFTILGNLFSLDIHTDNPYDYMLMDNYWSQTSLSRDKIQIISDLLSQDIKGFSQHYDLLTKEYLSGNDDFIHNFLPLAVKPIVKISESMSLIADPSYLEIKVTESPYFILLNNSSSPKYKRELSKYFGLLHQHYCQVILSKLCTKLIPIKRRPNQKTCDFVGVIYQDGINLLFIESKKISLSLSTTMFGEKQSTLKNLSNIFGDTGYKQVYETIKLFTEGQLDELAEYDKVPITAIFPIVITDKFIVEESLNRKFYEMEFLDKLEGCYSTGDNVSKPILLSSEELEVIESAFDNNHKFTFRDLLIQRHKQLVNRFYRHQKQFIKGGIIVGMGWMIQNMDTIWNYLYFYGYSAYENNRLRNIFEERFANFKEILFPTKG